MRPLDALVHPTLPKIAKERKRSSSYKWIRHKRKRQRTLRSLAFHYEDLTVQSVADPSASLSNQSPTCVSDQPSCPALNQPPTLIECRVLLRCRPASPRLASAISLSTLPSNPTSNSHRILVLLPGLPTFLRLTSPVSHLALRSDFLLTFVSSQPSGFALELISDLLLGHQLKEP